MDLVDNLLLAGSFSKASKRYKAETGQFVIPAERVVKCGYELLKRGAANRLTRYTQYDIAQKLFEKVATWKFYSQDEKKSGIKGLDDLSDIYRQGEQFERASKIFALSRAAEVGL